MHFRTRTIQSKKKYCLGYESKHLFNARLQQNDWKKSGDFDSRADMSVRIRNLGFMVKTR